MTATRNRTALCLVTLVAGLGVARPTRVRAAACAGTTSCGAATSVTYNGVALTSAGSATNGTVRAEIFYLKAPATGTHNVVVTSTVPTDITASSISFTGVNQMTPVGTFVSAIGTSATPSVVANTVLGEPIVDVMGAVGTTTPTVTGSTQTLRNTAATTVTSLVAGSSSAYGQAAPVTMSWSITSADWAIAALPIKASTALTGVEVDSFTATWGDDGTHLAWRSGYRPEVVGFYVYRAAGNSERTQLNPTLIEGGALTGTLTSFAYIDTATGWNGPVSYWLKEVKSDGTFTWYGPASPVPPSVATPATNETPASPTQSTDASVDVPPGAGGQSGGFGGASPAGPALDGGQPQGGCAIASKGRPFDLGRVLLVVGAVLGARRRRRRWVLPAIFLAMLVASSLWAPGRAVATGGVSVDATAAATGANGLTFTHTMGAGANGLIVVKVVTPITCINTTNDSDNCAACGATCSVDDASLASGLLGLWRFDEGTGTTSTDSSGNGNTATLNGGTWQSGYAQTAAQFNGTSSYGQATIGTWFGNNNTLTAAAWVYATANTNGPVFGVTAAPPGGGWDMPFLSINGATVYGWLWQVNGNNPLSTTVTLNAWHHLAITYDPTSGGTEKFYVDGVLKATGTGTYSPSLATDYWSTYLTGTKPSGVNNYLRGRVDEVRAYNRVLSAAEITSLSATRLACASSTCAACSGIQTSCSGSCVTTTTDNANCGSCAHACNTVGGESCMAGTCGCSSGTDCSTVCVVTTTDPNNCGGCGNTCGFGTPAFVDSGLLGLWHLNEGTGTTSADSSGNGRTATLTNTPTWTAGYSSFGLTFNGTSYLNATLGTWFGGNNTISASAWVYATSTTNGPIFGVTDTPPGGGWNMPFLSIAGPTVYGHLWQVNGNTPLSSTVTLNAWHHLAITYDPTSGGRERFYVDGAQVATATGTFSPSGASDTWTTNVPGAKPSGVNSVLSGTIDDVRAYNRVLSAAEIGIIYNSRQSCSASTCGGCGGAEVVCGGTCTDRSIDPNNCGSCGHACNTAGGETCVAGVCGCSSGMDCSTVCIDTTTDNNNCGGCGTTCGTTTCSSCSQGLLGLWHLDEGTGSTSADASGNGFTATLTSSPTWTAMSEAGPFALTFNGTSALAASFGSWFGANNTLSASAWVYATSTTNGPIFGVSSIPAGFTWDMPFLSINGATVYGWLWQVNGNTPLSATVTLNAWHFLTITYDPAVGEKFYVDGTLSGSGTGTFAPSAHVDSWTTSIPGARPSGVNGILTGTIDEVRAYNRVLAAGEVKLLYDARQSCASSSCGACPSGTTSCSGACTNTLADKNNCNACGTVCPGAQTCVAGACM